VNNVLGYPGIFRGALLSVARQINAEMKLAAAEVIAELASEAELVPDALDPNVHEQVADAVREAAVASGVAHPEWVPAGLRVQQQRTQSRRERCMDRDPFVSSEGAAARASRRHLRWGP
jgi:malic enzyme